jgi:DNA primase
MARIKPESIELLKAQIDIVEVVSHYLQLKRVGANFVALCPFHPEKTPSFYVSPKLQRYHCFGCGASGDAIKFVMEFEKLSFVEAVEKLATLYNFPLAYVERGEQGLSLQLLDRVANYYSSLLKPGTPGWEYLRGRGVSEESIEKFQIGFAPGREEQLRFFREAGFNFEELIRLGVLVKGERGPYPRLIERVTFPIHSTTGRVIAFGGRTIADHPAKYLNFSNTPLFNKSKALYGYHLAKEPARKSREIVVTEGYLDVVMLHQAGIGNVVATLGTALTSQHLPLLHRLGGGVVLCYDGDRAGREAALKGAALLFRAGLSGRVVLLPEGKDPADLVAAGENPRKYLEGGIDFGSFIGEEILRRIEPGNPSSATRVIQQIRPYLKSLYEEQREFLLQYLVFYTGISRERWLGEGQGPFGERGRGLDRDPFEGLERGGGGLGLEEGGGASPGESSGGAAGGALPPPVLEGGEERGEVERGEGEPSPSKTPNPFEEVEGAEEVPPPTQVSIAEGEIVKTLANHPDWIGKLEGLVKLGPPEGVPGLLRTHRRELELVYNGQLDHPAVLRLRLHPELEELSWGDLLLRVKYLELKWGKEELKRLSVTPLPAPEKGGLLREAKGRILRLKGEVERLKGGIETLKRREYESSSPF